MRPHTLAVSFYVLLLPAINGSSSPTPTYTSILNRLTDGFTERAKALGKIRSDAKMSPKIIEKDVSVVNDADGKKEDEEEGVSGFFRRRNAESKSETRKTRQKDAKDKEEETANRNGDSVVEIQDNDDLEEDNFLDLALKDESSEQEQPPRKRFAGFFNMKIVEDDPLESGTGSVSKSESEDKEPSSESNDDEPNKGLQGKGVLDAEQLSVPAVESSGKDTEAAKDSTKSKVDVEVEDDDDVNIGNSSIAESPKVTTPSFWWRRRVDKVEENEEQSIDYSNQEEVLIKDAREEIPPADKNMEAKYDDVEESQEGCDDVDVQPFEEEPTVDAPEFEKGEQEHTVQEGNEKNDAISTVEDTDVEKIDIFDEIKDDKKAEDYNLRAKGDSNYLRKSSMPFIGRFRRSPDNVESDPASLPQNETLSENFINQKCGSDRLEEGADITNSKNICEEKAIDPEKNEDLNSIKASCDDVDEDNHSCEGDEPVAGSVEKVEIDSIQAEEIELTDGQDCDLNGKIEDEEIAAAETSGEDSQEEEDASQFEVESRKDEVICDIDVKEAKTTSAFRQSLENALPWLGKKNEEKQQEEKQQEEEKEEDHQHNGPVEDTGKLQTISSQENAQGMVPFGGSPSPLIFFAPPPLPRNSQSVGSPRGIPPSSSVTMPGILHAVLPLITRLLLLTLLNGSALFGMGEGHIYAPEPSQHFMLERINDRYEKDGLAMKKALECPPEQLSKYSWALLKKRRKSALKRDMANSKKVSESAASLRPSDRYSRTVIIMDVETHDHSMSTVVQQLRDSVSFILSQYHDEKLRLEMGDSLEVVVCIESPGGVVQDFGLAADQLTRLKEAGSIRNDLTLTVCVDKIAASGGYMMACQASEGQLLAAPFSVVGSIGVLRETINIHDVLEKYGVKPLLLKAGDAKVPLTQTTKVTDESIAIVQNNLERVHDAFRNMIAEARGKVIAENFKNVTNGDIFLGKEGVANGLVDRLMTSDEYVAERVRSGDRVLRLHKYDRSRAGLRLSPLDLLLLRSNGLLGTHLSSKLRHIVKAGQQVLRVGTTVGVMKVVDMCLNTLKVLHREPGNGI